MSVATLPTDTASLYVQIYCNIFLYIYIISLFIISFGHPFSPQTLPLFIFIFHFLQNTSDEQSKGRTVHSSVLHYHTEMNGVKLVQNRNVGGYVKEQGWRRTGNKKFHTNSCFQSALLCALCTELFQVITYLSHRAQHMYNLFYVCSIIDLRYYSQFDLVKNS